MQIKKRYLKDFLSAYNQCCVINLIIEGFIRTPQILFIQSQEWYNIIHDIRTEENHYGIVLLP